MRSILFVVSVLVPDLLACGPKTPDVTTPVATGDPAPPVDRGDPAPPPADKGALAPPAHLAFLTECRGMLDDARRQRQVVVDLVDNADVKVPRTVDSVLVPFNEITRYTRNASSIASLFAEVHPDARVRDAARMCDREAAAFATELWLDKRLYDAVASVDVKAGDPATKYYVANVLREFQRAGVLLDAARRTRVKELEDQLTEVGQEISRTIAEDTRYIEISDQAKLAGLPADFVAAHPADANGVVKISTDNPDRIPFMTYATDDELRRQLYVKFRSRGDATNEQAIAKMLALRAERAKLLGFKNWADYISDDKMLRGGANAAKFIDRVTQLVKPRARQDYDELLAQLRKTSPKATAVGEWQQQQLEALVKKDKYDVDNAVVRAYFSYDKVLAGLLEITGTIYDLQYRSVTDPRTWHPDVKVFDVVRGGTRLGRIFLDMHPRADKYKHAAQFTLRDGVVNEQLPEGVLVCNFPNPKTASGPALMEHVDVVTMFHEFGHLMHHVLGGQQRWVLQSGVATEHDFVEAPSMMFEEWAWSHETLSRFAKHHQTGEVIPAALVAKMQKARRFGIGAWVAQQMLYADISLQFHQADPKKLDPLALLKKLQVAHVPFAYTPGTKFYTSFGHLVGYSSMYYTYLWSLVIAKDLLTPFAKTGLLDTATAHRYRDKILAAGGTKPAAELVTDFLGRKYDFMAFERYVTGK